MLFTASHWSHDEDQFTSYQDLNQLSLCMDDGFGRIRFWAIHTLQF